MATSKPVSSVHSNDMYVGNLRGILPIESYPSITKIITRSLSTSSHSFLNSVRIIIQFKYRKETLQQD